MKNSFRESLLNVARFGEPYTLTRKTRSVGQFSSQNEQKGAPCDRHLVDARYIWPKTTLSTALSYEMLFLLLQRAALQRAPRVLIRKSRISKICKTEEAVKHRYMIHMMCKETRYLISEGFCTS